MMKNLEKTRLSILGISSLVLFYFSVELGTSAEFWRYLSFPISKQTILQKAQKSLQEKQETDFEPNMDFDFSFDEKTLQFLQQKQDSLPENPLVDVATCRVEFFGKIEEGGNIQLGGENEKKKDITYSWTYNNRGEETGFSFPRKLASGKELTKQEAIQQVKVFLAARGVDSSQVKLASYKQESKENQLYLHLIFQCEVPDIPQLTHKYEISFSGGQITQFDTDFEVAKTWSDRYENKWNEYVLITIFSISWLLALLFLITSFIHRLRRDELDLKQGGIAGVLMFVITFAMIALGAYPSTSGMLIGGFFGGFFIALAYSALFVTGYSITREQFPAKIETADLILCGSLHVHEIGAAMLRALFFGGLLLFLLTVLQKLSEFLPAVQFIPKTEDFWILNFNRQAVAGFLNKLVKTSFIVGIFFVYLPAAIKSKIAKSRHYYFALLAILLIALFSTNFKPDLFGFIIALPLAALAAWLIIRYDTLTAILTGFIYYIGCDLKYLNLEPAGFSGAYGLALYSTAGLFLLAAIYFVFRGKPAAKLQHYVPEYVSRIAERERMLQELEIARDVQKRFLPEHVPSFPRLEIAAICTPAMEVGGDYYDFIKTDERHFSVVIGDVSGKGVSAAFYMTMAKGIIQTLARNTWRPRQILIELNEVFFNNSPREVFISVIWGVFDVVANKLIFARAGHNPLIVHKHQTREPEFLSPKGLGIGLATGQVFSNAIEEKEVPIADGDVFIFYTDGISEAMDQHGEEFSEQRLIKLVNKHANLSAEDILAAVKSEIDTFTGAAPQHDDFTMVVVKVVTPK